MNRYKTDFLRKESLVSGFPEYWSFAKSVLNFMIGVMLGFSGFLSAEELTDPDRRNRSVVHRSGLLIKDDSADLKNTTVKQKGANVLKKLILNSGKNKFRRQDLFMPFINKNFTSKYNPKSLDFSFSRQLRICKMRC